MDGYIFCGFFGFGFQFEIVTFRSVVGYVCPVTYLFVCSTEKPIKNIQNRRMRQPNRIEIHPTINWAIVVVIDS